MVLELFWPTLEAPVKLTGPEEFRKFCFYAEKPENQSLTFPEGYVPIDFRSDWKVWHEHKKEFEANIARQRERRKRRLSTRNIEVL